jgi:hypothetical protein
MRLHKSQVIKASFFKYIRSDGKDGKAALMSCPEEVNLSTMTLMKKYAVCFKFLEGK